MLAKIAFIGTGGTIASIGTDQFDLLDYNASQQRLDAAALIERIGIQGTDRPWYGASKKPHGFCHWFWI